MRNGYRHPVAGIVLMVLLFGLIAVFFVMTGNIAPFGRGVALILAAAIVAAGLVTLILTALRRAGVHRLAEVRTWPQNLKP